MEALHDLIKSGKVRYIGASSMWAVQFAQMQFVAEKNGWTKVRTTQAVRCDGQMLTCASLSQCRTTTTSSTARKSVR